MLVFDVLTRIAEEADLLGMSKAQAFFALQRFLTGCAARRYRSAQGAPIHAVGKFTYWPVVVQYVLRLDATLTTICEAVMTICAAKQMLTESKLNFSLYPSFYAHHRGNVYAKDEEMTHFIYELLRTIQTIVEHHCESKPGSVLTKNKWSSSL